MAEIMQDNGDNISGMDIAEAIMVAARGRGSEKSICPSEVARALFGSDWRRHMGKVLEVATGLHLQQKVVITQGDRVVDVGQIKGPVRIRIAGTDHRHFPGSDLSYEPALILTVRMDSKSQGCFQALRAAHFPPERNFLGAHLTLFHKLPVNQQTFDVLQAMDFSGFEMQATGIFSLGAGVAFRLESPRLSALRSHLAAQFHGSLGAQDSQGFRPHVTIQNKVGAEVAKKLLIELSEGFQEFRVAALGLDLWEYLGGPWKHREFYPFKKQ